MIRKITWGFAAVLLLAILLLTLTYMLTMPEPLAAESESAQWLQPGPYTVATTDRLFVDETRETAANGDAPRLPSRQFTTRIWYPESSAESLPLIIHSHGFVSERSDMGYVAELLASHGYVVAAANFPLTAGDAAGGPNANDLVNQPADVSFLIDAVLELATEDNYFGNTIDTDRIGLTGYSLGGITTSLATYHPRLRDERIAAAVSIAGPSTGLTRSFYNSTDVPFMMIAGNADALVDFRHNAAIIPGRVRNSLLLEISGGSHLGFAAISEPLLRLMRHPDGIGCAAVLANADSDASAFIRLLGDESDGIVIDSNAPAVCETTPTRKAMHPGRQQRLTAIAVLSFFESIFDEDSTRRDSAYQQLTRSLGEDFPEASVTASAIKTRVPFPSF